MFPPIFLQQFKIGRTAPSGPIQTRKGPDSDSTPSKPPESLQFSSKMALSSAGNRPPKIDQFRPKTLILAEHAHFWSQFGWISEVLGPNKHVCTPWFDAQS